MELNFEFKAKLRDFICDLDQDWSEYLFMN